MKKYFITGLLIWIPLVITIWVLKLVVDVLEKLVALKPSSLEKAESLEQLRWLENGFRIRGVETEFDSHCIDSPGDIEKVLRIMNIRH